MQTNINSIHFSADKKLINFIEKKIKKMSLFNNSLLSADVFLKLEPSTKNFHFDKVLGVEKLVSGNLTLKKIKSKTFHKDSFV